MPKEEKEKAKKIVVVEEVSSEDIALEKDETKVEEKEKEDLEFTDTKKPETDKEEKESETSESKKIDAASKEKVVKKEKEKESEKTNYLWIIIPTALLVGALVGGFITYFSGVSKLDKENVTSTPIPTEMSTEPSPTASPAATLKRDTLKIQVLNGSGVGGAAGKAKTYLEDLGYLDVDTGNASTSDFTETEVSIKKDMEEYIDLVTTDLSKNYQVADDAKTLVTTSKYDVVITLGKK